MTGQEALTAFLTALLGGGGAVGLMAWAVRRGIEDGGQRRRTARGQQEEARRKLEQLLRCNTEVHARLDAMAAENTLQCYCLLAALRGLAEQGCDGPVKDGIDRLEKYLNKTAHGVE